MEIAPEKTNIFAIVLAAGSATRFGSSKQLAEWNGETLVQHAVAVARQCCAARTILVAGHDWRAVRSACTPLDGFFLVNDKYREGMGTSLSQAVRSVRHFASAIIVLLADQPMIDADHVSALIEKWSGSDRAIVASSYADTSGVPALFGSACFDKLGALSGDQGARSLMDDDEFELQSIEFEDAAADIDTVADLVRLTRNAHS